MPFSSNRRKFLSTVGTSAFLGVAGCLGDEMEGGIRIGVLAPEPETNPIGSSMRNAAHIAAQEINNEGGLLDEDIAIVTGDTEQDAARARDAYNQLVVGEDVDATVGPFTSEELLAIIDQMADEQKLHFSCAAATMEPIELLQEDYERYKYFFRTGPYNGIHLGEVLAEMANRYFEEVLGWERIAVMFEDAAWADDTIPLMEDLLPEVVDEVVDFVRFPQDTRNFRPIYSDFENQDIDGVMGLMAATGETAVMQWHDDERPFGFGGFHLPSQFPFLWEQLDGSCEFAWTYDTAKAGIAITDKTEPFSQAYSDEFRGDPLYAGYHAYDAVILYAAYVEEAGTLDPEELIPMMANNELSVTTSSFQPHEFYGPDEQYPHDVIYDEERAFEGSAPPVFHQWQDGERIVFAPELHAEGEYQQPRWL